MIMPKLDAQDLGVAYRDTINPLVKNFTDETFNYKVQKRDGSAVEGKIEPNGYVQVPNLRIGDAMKLWNSDHVAHQEFTQPKNSKYILAHRHNRRDVLFKNRGYHPIIVNRIIREPPQVVVVEQPTPPDSHDHKIFILIFVVIIALAIGLAVSLVLASRRGFTGSAEAEVVESIYV